MNFANHVLILIIFSAKTLDFGLFLQKAQMSLQDYLAQNYLVASNAGDFGGDITGGGSGENGVDYEDSGRKKKKRKSKKTSERESVKVVNDDADDAFRTAQVDSDEDDLDGPTVETSSKDQKLGASRKWKKLNGPSERDVRSKIATDTLDVAQHGLQTPDQVALYLQKKSDAEAEMIKQLGREGPSNETVYRDASGRRIDISSVRADARRKEREEAEERARLHRDLNRGLVQKHKSAQSGLDKDVRYTRNADDEDRNEEMKSKANSFHDPAASFLSKKKTKGKESASSSVTGRRLYQGHFAPNRFGIVPGHRWDGVDRSNGFENLWFKKQNEIAEKKKLEYSMSYDM